MIRWSYVLPRLVILVLVILAVWLGLDPLLRWSLISLGQQITSAKVEIGRLETSLGRTEIRLCDVALADPDSPMKNLVEAREIELGLETGPLLRRKLIVREGRLSGLRFGTERQTSGALEKKPHRPGEPDDGDHPLAHRLAHLADSWLDSLADRLQEDLAGQIEQLESVRLARDLAQRWPREYVEMERRADVLKARAEDLRNLFQGGTGNLLRNVDATSRALDEVEAIQREIAEFRVELDRLRQQASRDKDAIGQARQSDVEQLGRRLRLDELKGENLSDYLLGPELAEKVRTVTGWVRWARKHWPRKDDSPAPVRARGVDVVFAAPQPVPDFLLRKVSLDGEGQFRDQAFQFAGTAEGITSQPALYGQPAVLKLAVEGAGAMSVEAVLDRTREVPYDRITVECPELPMPRRVLGRADRMAVAVSPGSTHLSLVLHLEGEGLWGRMTLRQEPVELAPTVAPRFGGPRLAADLQEALGRIRSIEVIADLSGTLAEPDCRLRSDLGPQLAEAVNWLIQRELEARRDELIAFLQRQLDTELAQFDRLIQARQEAVLAKLNLSGDQLRDLRQLFADRLPGADKLLGRPLPVQIPLRF